VLKETMEKSVPARSYFLWKPHVIECGAPSEQFIVSHVSDTVRMLVTAALIKFWIRSVQMFKDTHGALNLVVLHVVPNNREPAVELYIRALFPFTRQYAVPLINTLIEGLRKHDGCNSKKPDSSGDKYQTSVSIVKHTYSLT
jgi:hypothetical protein